jgi:hypothetical protein
MTRPAFPLRTLTVLVCLLAPARAAFAQTNVWVVDPPTSLAWWQMSPNLNHLWSTTCPADPDWRPGEGRSGGWEINPKLKLDATGYAAVPDTIHVPLFPRHIVSPICTEAMRGKIVVDDTMPWRMHGTIYAKGELLVTGESMRDIMMHHALETVQYPEITFRLDSILNMTRHGDTLVGTAQGFLTVRTVVIVVNPVVKVFPDPAGLRVLAKWEVPATEIGMLTPYIHEFGLGINTRIWQTFFMGCDVILRHPHTED